MATILLRLALAVAFITPIWSVAASTEVQALESTGKTPHQRCHGQSCKIAALSGSSGKPYHPSSPPKGGSDAGDCCILRYNPSARKALYQEHPVLKRKCGHKRSMPELDDVWDEEKFDIIERASCRPHTLIFAKGTDETGRIGDSVGPALKQGLDQKQPGKWSVLGVAYANDQFGIYCLGLPGGAKAVKLLENVARKCPDTKIVMSGYSQGAMVARNAIAYSHRKAHERVKGIVTFGDPFNGAPIKGYNGPIKVYCAKGDRVCDGRDIISSAHLSYAGMDTSEAVDYLIKKFG